MNQVLEFGKRYGKWIATGVAAAAITVAGVLAYRSASEEDENYVEPVETDVAETEVS
jgi:hypothetical protein